MPKGVRHLAPTGQATGQAANQAAGQAANQAAGQEEEARRRAAQGGTAQEARPLSRSRPTRFRRSRHLVGYWEGPRLVLENYATRTRTAAPPLTVEILDRLDDWRSLDELTAALPGAGRASLRRALLALERRSLVERHDRRRPAERLLESWASWNPAAGLLHFSTKDVGYGDYEEGERELRRQARMEPPPPAQKRYPRAALVRLPPAQTTGELPSVLLGRRTWRRFSRRPVGLPQLATLLGLTFGVQGWMRLGPLGRVPLKTSPSGGARHPLEAYVLALRVQGLAPGLYHYAAQRHVLERLRAGATRRQLEGYLPQQWWYGGAALLALITAVFPRTRWRYDNARAYRVVLAEAGHFCQTFCLVATALGLAPFCSMALADSRIEADLGIDGVTESVIYAAGVGTRPADASASRPGVPRPRIVRR